MNMLISWENKVGKYKIPKITINRELFNIRPRIILGILKALHTVSVSCLLKVRSRVSEDLVLTIYETRCTAATPRLYYSMGHGAIPRGLPLGYEAYEISKSSK